MQELLISLMTIVWQQEALFHELLLPDGNMTQACLKEDLFFATSSLLQTAKHMWNGMEIIDLGPRINREITLFIDESMFRLNTDL